MRFQSSSVETSAGLKCRWNRPMADIRPFRPSKAQLYAALSPEERQFAGRLLEVAPNYRYDRSGLPKLDPIPAAGLASAVAAAKVLTVWVKFAMRHRARSG
jgi:hypothetical protein